MNTAARKPSGTETPLVLALDVGSSSVRGALYDGRGLEVEGTQERLVRGLKTTAGGGAELDAREAAEETARVIDAVVARAAALGARVEAVAVACFWHSLVGLDERGRPLTPVFGWADTRAARHAEMLKRRLDEGKTHARTGCRFHPSYWPARLLWLKEERPEIFRGVRRWVSFGELLSARFFEEQTASVSMASGTGMLDVRSCRWDEELLETTGVTAEQLPAVEETYKPLGELTGEYARRWPALRGARWFPAIGDGAANNIGAGCTGPERVALMVGTSGAMRVMWEGEPPAQLPAALWCYRADRSRVLAGGALSDGGGLFHWMTDALRLNEHAEETEKELASIKPDAHGLTVLPFWSGERSTGWNAQARGAILGLTMHTRPVEILRAAMEAIAYRFALVARALDSLAPRAEVVASGGALAASRVWPQMLADVLARPVRRADALEASSRGAALLALEATGKLKSIADAEAPTVQTFEPDTAAHALYRAGLERHEKLYARLVADEAAAREVSRST
ncbi:MAG TPA: gluconokinase [Pyrinomonadaceae bacterium]|nr:gluconokinase [Pyrinomonadaceae bacterium]